MPDKKKHSTWNLLDRIEGDKVVWIITLMLILISIVCIFSSTSRLKDVLQGTITRVDVVRSQLLTAIAGLGLIVLCYNIKSLRLFRILSMLAFPLSFFLLLFVDLHLDLGFVQAGSFNGAWRIIVIRGFQVHVFEIVKVAMVMYLAWAMEATRNGRLEKPADPLWQRILYIYVPFLVTIVMIMPGSAGSAVFLGGIMFVTILLGGGSFREMSLLLAAGLVALVCCWGVYEVSGHKWMKRVGTGIARVMDDTDYEKVYLAPDTDKQARQEALDKIRQPYGAKIAIHEGGLIGKGPGQSTQRYFVPDLSEDYMYSFIIEEYGLLGGLLVILLYVSLLARGSIIARNCKESDYAKLAVAGLCLLITGQAFLHFFVNIDVGPMTGQTLPLISHGKSAFLCFSIAFGIILSLSRIAARRVAREQKDIAPLLPHAEGEGNKPDNVNPAEATAAEAVAGQHVIYDYELQEPESHH